MARAVEFIASLNELHALRSQWNALWQADSQATPFQSPAWLLPWAHHFACDRTRAVVLRGHDALVAVVPFFTWQGKLLLAGTGLSDYGDGLFAPGHDAAAGAVLNALCAAARKLDCDCVDLQQLRVTSPLLQAAALPDWRSEISDGDVCPVAVLTGVDGLDGIPSRRKKNLAYARRSLARLSDCCIRLAGADELARTLARIAQLHAQRWGARDEAGIFRDARTHAFIDAALPELAGDEVLRLHILQINAEIAAAALVVRNPSVACLYLCTFDARWSRYSPGLMTIEAAMRHAANEGTREFHFLRGREAYKHDLGAVDAPTFRRRLWPCLRSRRLA
jgi:CelD/BcsL family acetyltransferase involved in cellulose biosynthesis